MSYRSRTYRKYHPAVPKTRYSVTAGTGSDDLNTAKTEAQTIADRTGYIASVVDNESGRSLAVWPTRELCREPETGIIADYRREHGIVAPWEKVNG
jgi:hypothetical protein